MGSRLFSFREVQCKQAALESKNRTQEVEVAKTLDQAQERIRELVAELEAKHKKLKVYVEWHDF